MPQNHISRSIAFIPYSRRPSTRAVPSGPLSDEFDASAGDPDHTTQKAFMQAVKKFISKGQIPTYDPSTGEIVEWNVPFRVLSSGAMKAISPISWRFSAGYMACLCFHAHNKHRVLIECEMEVKSVQRLGKTYFYLKAPHKGCGYTIPIPYNGAETFDLIEEDEEDSSEEIDVYSTAYHTRNYATPSSSRTRSASSPPDYTPSPSFPDSDNTTPSPSPKKGKSKVYVVTEKGVIFTPQQMAERASIDWDLAETLIGAEEEGLWISEPAQHPAWKGNTLPSRIVPYVNLGPTDLFDHLQFFETPIGRALKDLNSTTGLIPGAFRTLCGESCMCWRCLCEYSSTAYMSHIEDGACLNSQCDTKDYSFVETNPHIEERLLSLSGNPPSELPRRDALWSLVGTIFLMWNSRFGIPSDVWAFARTAVITCKNCSLVRTFDADKLHRIDGKCSVHTVFEEGTSSRALVLYNGKGKDTGV
ncbi:hypothetical protein AAF712_016160 [Marasmius tenuissimus]|uniref:Uncharacterized protein n=1 Tax=Marasmius tenuissimus TaxID=585030 RepID=A0ABR2Z9S7_9AGAR